MIARVGLLMVVYVAVGMLLAVGYPRPAEPTAPPQTVGNLAAAPPDTRPSAEADELEAAVPSTSTTTVAWTSGRIDTLEASAIPSWIELPSLGVSAQVVQTGVDPETHQMEIPATPDEVGWYRFGPRPGEQGSAVLAGHVDMTGYGPGAFFDLDRLYPGSVVVIHMSDGTQRGFEVVDTTRVPKSELDIEAIFDNTGPARVTLVTCGGAFNQTERTYQDNVVSHLRPLGVGA